MKKQMKCGIAAAAIFMAAAAVFVGCIKLNKPEIGEVKAAGNIKVTDEEKAQYKNMIGSSMNVKKAVLILFDTDMECREFIEKHGAEKLPQEAGVGMVPYMENGYYNIVGKAELEAAFDALADGEYTKEPVKYSGMFCYMKRLSEDKPLEDNKTLEELIRRDKLQKEESGVT